MKLTSIGRWTVRSLRAAALTAGLVCGTAAVLAQAPGSSAPTQTKKTYTKNTTFNLPIQMEERVRATLREVQLYVKTGNGDWVRQEAVSPQTPYFQYRVPQDGEYWFSLVTVDRQGRQNPTDVNSGMQLRVVVDTRAPGIEGAIAIENNEPVLRVNVLDANADMNSVRAFVLLDGGGERALTPVPGNFGGFRLSPNDLNMPLRITAADLSGNLANLEKNARDLLANPPQPIAAQPQLPQQLPSSSGLVQAQGFNNPPPNYVPPTPAYNPPPVSTPMPPPNAPPVAGGITNTNYRLPADSGDRPTNRKIINTTHASIDYRIDTVGPSGIGRVDIWLTPDKGQNWTKIAEDQDKRSPAEIDLPGEGLFGIRMAITNGNGFGGKAPRTGDRPTFFIEVDATSPFVQLQPIDMVSGGGAIDIRWTASDLNMSPEPVSIFYRSTPTGQWLPVARNIKNDGSYRWQFPRDIGAQFYLKLEVADMAGNLTKVETPTPILLDMTEPEATIADVTGIQPRAPMGTPTAPPGGNGPANLPNITTTPTPPPSLLPGTR